jgi:hypothetical protein
MEARQMLTATPAGPFTATVRKSVLKLMEKADLPQTKGRRRGWLRFVVIVVSLALYAVACTQPGTVVGLGHREGIATGLGLLLYGWAPGLPVVLPWLSNFLWLAGLVLLARGRPGWALGCSAVGLLFASLVLLPLPELGGRLLEAKWWWLGSQAALAVGCGLAWFLRPSQRPLIVDPDFSDPVGVKSSD